MGFGFRLAPGVRISASSRGMRVGLGPRAARVHLGAGRPGISTGVGPFTAWTSLGGSTRRRPSGRTSVAAHERQLRQEQRLVEVQEQLAIDQALINDFLLAHQEDFTPAVRPVASAVEPVDESALRRRRRGEECRGIPFWRIAARRAARRRADDLTARDAEQERMRRERARAEKQRELDCAWQAFVDGDEECVLAALEAAFEDNQAPAAAVGFADGALSVIVRFPQVDGLIPERYATTTPTGRPTIKKRTKTARHEMYLLALCSCVVATIKEALAVAPSVRVINLVGVWDTDGDHVLTPIFYGAFDRGRLARVDWSRDANRILLDTASDRAFEITGRTMEPQPLNLGDEPQLRESIETIAQQLGLRLDPLRLSVGPWRCLRGGCLPPLSPVTAHPGSRSLSQRPGGQALSRAHLAAGDDSGVPLGRSLAAPPDVGRPRRGQPARRASPANSAYPWTERELARHETGPEAADATPRRM